MHHVDGNWRCSYFALRNPAGATQEDLPRLLRRVATQISALGSKATVLDVVVHDDFNDFGPLWSVTVYYTLTEQPD